MQHDQKQLHQIALDYPWIMFTGEEIAELCNVSQNVISRAKAMSDNPFFLNKCRPEWFLEWMRNHPEFQLTKAAGNLPSNESSTVEINSPVKNGTKPLRSNKGRLRSKRRLS